MKYEQTDLIAPKEATKQLDRCLDAFWQSRGHTGSFAQHAREPRPDSDEGRCFTGSGSDQANEDSEFRLMLAYLVRDMNELAKLLCDENEIDLSWQVLAIGQSVMLMIQSRAEPNKKIAAQILLALRHKDANADRAYIKKWYLENWEQFVDARNPKGNKEKAADFAFKNRLVDRARTVIRGYLRGVEP